jgi:hypothetical protein
MHKSNLWRPVHGPSEREKPKYLHAAEQKENAIMKGIWSFLSSSRDWRSQLNITEGDEIEVSLQMSKNILSKQEDVRDLRRKDMHLTNEIRDT